MTRKLLGLAFGFAVWLGASTAHADGHHSDADWLATVTAFSHYWYASYNGGTFVEDFEVFYDDDIVVRNTDGTVTVGKEASFAQLQAWSDAGLVFRPGPDVAPIASGLLSDDSAWALFQYEITDDAGNFLASGQASWLYVRTRGGWKIVAVTNIDTTPAPSAP